MRPDETKGEGNHLIKPYLGGTRVEYKSLSSIDLPPCLDWGRGDRKLGIWGN